MARLQVTGLAELQKFLDTLPAKMEANVMRGGLRAGATQIATTAKSNAPVGQPGGENKKNYGGYAGALRDSIRVGTKLKRGTVTASVKAGGKTKRGADVYYAHFVEFGTARHTITGKDGRPLSFGTTLTKSVDHPGAGARPFMRPALDAEQSAAIVATANYVKKRLETKHGINTGHIFIEGDE
jgi:HK97 gp10 family phage protein